jgi:hypothetical protein
MAAPIYNQSPIMAVRKMKFQLASTVVATIPWALKITDANPLTAGIAAQIVAAVLKTVSQRYSKPPSELTKWVVFVGTFSAAYIVTSQLDQRVQAIFFLLFLMDDVRVIGPKYVWKEIKRKIS